MYFNQIFLTRKIILFSINIALLNYGIISLVFEVQGYTECFSNWTCCSCKLWLLAKDDSKMKTPEYRLHKVLRKDADAEIGHILNENPLLVNGLAEFGFTPLHIATKSKRYSAMKLLLLPGRRSDDTRYVGSHSTSTRN